VEYHWAGQAVGGCGRLDWSLDKVELLLVYGILDVGIGPLPIPQPCWCKAKGLELLSVLG